MDPAASSRAPRQTVQYTTENIEPIWRQQDDGQPSKRLRDDWHPGVLHHQVKRIWRISVFMLFLLLLATAVHVVQFFVHPANFSSTGQRLNTVQGMKASYAPQGAWRSFPRAGREDMGNSADRHD